MFQLLLFTGSIIAFIIGGLVVLIGIGAITGCAGGLIVMMAGGIVAFLGVWSAIAFFLPLPENIPSKAGVINLIKHDGKWK
ncbi:MAG: hypothetical protein HF978_03115 [Desulfobacteraceae bacterium]|nr:hypothetical protein [Desulfobacteraceae bacterium]MBC2754515.1 hypothetical protein [Desulfobacteraceae bacterium]